MKRIPALSRIRVAIVHHAKRTATTLLALALACSVLGAIVSAGRAYLWAGALAAAIVAVFVVLHNLSERLWKLQSSVFEEANLAWRRGAAFTTVEIHAALAIRDRFPGLTIPTSTYSMRFANLMAVIDSLDRAGPKVVVELGSGISTLCVAAWLREQGRGKVWSFDHDAQWCETTRQHLIRCGLNSYAEVILAPLCQRSCREHRLKWYDLEKHLDSFDSIDVLIVDGPPLASDPTGLSRLPAVDVFARRVAPNGIVIIDDAVRPGERALIEAWKVVCPLYTETYVPSVSGLAILSEGVRA